MKVFVTGATGFLGRAFCEAAVSDGHDVLGLCRNLGADLPDGCERVQGSLASIPWNRVEHFAPDVALHLAWIVTPGHCLSAPENESLVEQSDDLFRMLAERGVHIAGTGTCIEYAPSISPLHEDSSPLAPAFAYSRAKVATCRRLQALATTRKVAWTWFRIFYVYGEGEHPERISSTLMRKLASGGIVELKTPDSIKDYIHVKDAAEAMLAALKCRLEGIVNIGTGEGVRIMDLAQIIAGALAGDAALVRRSAPSVEDPFPVTIADIAKLRSLGWRQKISLDEGIARLRQSMHLA